MNAQLKIVQLAEQEPLPVVLISVPSKSLCHIVLHTLKKEVNKIQRSDRIDQLPIELLLYASLKKKNRKLADIALPYTYRY